MEFKSWTPRDNDEEDSPLKCDRSQSSFYNFSIDYGSYGQFLCYLRNINSLSQLRYFSDKQKLVKYGVPDPDAYVKNIFKTMFQCQGVEVGNILKTKPLFWSELDDLTVNYLDDFENSVNAFEKRLYGFINIKYYTT